MLPIIHAIFPADSHYARIILSPLTRYVNTVTYCFLRLAHIHQTYDSGLDHPLAKRADATLSDSASAFVQNRVGIHSHSLLVHSAYAGEVAKHAYMKQRVNNLTIANAVANVAFNNANQVVAFGSSFVTDGQYLYRSPSCDLHSCMHF